MTTEKLKLRMYGLTPYQLSGIQIGIQFGHGVVEYGLKYSNTELYKQWANNDKTFIILNGGTTNSRIDEMEIPFGTLNQHLNLLNEYNIGLATFNEPDLGDLLTSIVFIVDERVFNFDVYPEFDVWVKDKYIFNENDDEFLFNDDNDDVKDKYYHEWVEFIGGEKNVFLKDFLKKFRLA